MIVSRFDKLDVVFALLEAAANTGERCPFSEQVPGGSRSFSLLAREGRIIIEVYMHNFRRVTILAGPHKGKHTQNAPRDRHGNVAKPYLTVSKDGTRRNGKIVDNGFKHRTQPSLKDYSRGA